MGRHKIILSSSLTILFVLILTQSFEQEHDSVILQKILALNKVSKTYKFVSPEDSTETYLRYLGQLTSNKGNIYKIVTSTWIWGPSHRATNKILVFDGNRRYVGNYYVTMTYDLPEKIENNKLIFLNAENNGCDSKLITKLSFSNGIPKELFLKCKGDMGDFYSFSND